MPCLPDRIDRILFAEDDSGIRSVVTEMLCFEGFDVTAVESGDRAAVVLETERFNLLLTDVRMPGTKDGLDLAVYAWRHDPGLPVIIISGFAEGLSSRLQQMRGRMSFLQKPFRADDLMHVIRMRLLRSATNA